MEAQAASSDWGITRQLDRLAYHAQQCSLRAPLAALRYATLALSPHAREAAPDRRKPPRRRIQGMGGQFDPGNPEHLGRETTARGENGFGSTGS